MAEADPSTVDAAGIRPRERTVSRELRGLRSASIYALLAFSTLAVWQLAASLTIPILLPSPIDVGRAFARGLSDGSLLQHVGVSYYRILVGWAVGCAVAIPLAILAGRVPLARTLLEPYIEFFRFIPPIAFVTLFMIWFGLGELSKIALIVYTAFFTTFLNTMAGAMSVERERIRAAQCLGATPRQVFFRVIVPATVPYIITGVRLALGLAFMTVVAAEFIAAQAGVGYLIFNSRLFAQTDNVFVGIITLGLMGFTANWLLKAAVARIAYRYDVKL
jgi:NitT/TauT family transport system permease protein